MMKSLKDSLIDERHVEEIVEVLNQVRQPSIKHESRHLKQSKRKENRASMSELIGDSESNIRTSTLDESVVVLKPMNNYDSNAQSRVSQKDVIISKAKSRNSLV